MPRRRATTVAEIVGIDPEGDLIVLPALESDD
jgi:hypothetical protein